MSVLKRILLTALIGFTGLATVQADMQVSRLDANRAHRSAVANQAVESSVYIVQMKDSPVIAYQGNIKRFKATKPGKGKKLNRNSAHVKRYSAYLKRKQNRVARSVGVQKVYNYRYALNGFAARMTAADADKLRANPDVLKVWKDEIRQLQTDTSPTYIGITEAGQAWSKGFTGENVVIGVIDNGIWPEHPSFADVKTPKKGNKGPKRAYGPLDDFIPSGCDFGNTDANPADAAFSCNNKLLAARCYNLGFSDAFDATNPCGGNGFFTAPWEFQSGRDADGHGSHTASTAGGNNGVPAYIDGEYQGDISGVAPRARLATYKVCWTGNPDTGTDDGCASSDSAAAIDQAVADGVDVINFSIGGSSNYFAAPDDVAFLFAADAGVFVATSNGNAGPGAGTVGTPSGVPWITATGATQDDGVFAPRVTVNSPGSIAGVYIATEGAGDVSLEDTGPITDNVTLASTVTACNGDGPNDPISGIALVARGACSFSEKYNNVTAAGAIAIIVYTYEGTPLITMLAPGTSIPGVLVSYEVGTAMAGKAGVNATLSLESQVNRVAGFSSRGPNNGAADIIKPDVSAPGVTILAAVSPWGAGGEEFGNISGTSMASPHVAGSFAMLKQAHPDWTPAIARSALMTTARNGLLKTFGDELADPFDVGAGEILPSNAFDPGLSYDTGWWDYMAFTCDNNFNLAEAFYGSGICQAIVDAGYSTDGSDLNLPSIGIGELVGVQTITRTVTAVYNNNGKQNFTVSVDAPAGIDVSVSPSSFKLGKGDSLDFEVTFTVTEDATLSEWAFGSLTWTSGPHTVRSPIAVLPVAISTPFLVAGNADSNGDGSVDVPVIFGYEGPYFATVDGLAESLGQVGNVSTVQVSDEYCTDVPPNTFFRAATYDADTTDPGYDDIDMQVCVGLDASCAGADSNNLLGCFSASAGPTSEESSNIAYPPGGVYFTFIDYYSASNGTDVDYTLWTTVVGGDEGNTMVTAPASAVLGASGTVTVDYNGLNTGGRYAGVLHHNDGSGDIAITVMDIDTQ
ncbi:MAG: S8 family serine peptidase [Xanthomonadales bacterium]|nr:S8 family serine peptidase [Xanthomonadales bacterium]